MITRFRLENFKGHRETELALQPLTLLVGDNASGKTSVLEALRLITTLMSFVEHGDQLFLGELIRRGAAGMKLSYQGKEDGEPWRTSVEVAPRYDDLVITIHGVDSTGDELSGTMPVTALRDHPLLALRESASLTGRSVLYRFHSEQIAAAAYSDTPEASVQEDGAQTAVALAALKLADDEAFARIEDAMRRLVPSLQRLRIRPAEVMHPSNPNPVIGSKLYFDFHNPKDVPAHHASQGTLIVLALLTVLHGRDRPRVILLDDFDHALHPRAQIELVRMLKELLALEEFKDTQIIATTHSPYVLDEVSPSNVIAFALREDGTVASKPLSEHPDAPKVNGSLKAGELWTLDAERDWVR